jgi:hypothetical protein
MKLNIMTTLVLSCVLVAEGCSTSEMHRGTDSVCSLDNASQPHMLFGLGIPEQLQNETACLKNGVVLACEYLHEGMEIDDETRAACRKYAEVTQLCISRLYASFVQIPRDRVIEYKESAPCESYSINGVEQGSCSPRIEALLPFDSVIESTHNKAF